MPKNIWGNDAAAQRTTKVREARAICAAIARPPPLARPPRRRGRGRHPIGSSPKPLH